MNRFRASEYRKETGTVGQHAVIVSGRRGEEAARWETGLSQPRRFWIALAFLATCLLSSAGAADWYVAPNGDDKAAGSIEKPFATVQRAQDSASAGDTVFIRGGTYQMKEARKAGRRGPFSAITHLDKNGAPGKPITYTAYPGEKPVFDCSLVKPEGMRVSAFLVSGDWLHLRGIEVTGVQVTIQGHTQSICFESQGNHNIFECLSMHDGQAIGIYHVDGKENLFLNCDAWNNWDSTSEDRKGGNVDGFGCHPTKGSTGNIFRGCRAWFNSDDGFDCIGAREAVVFENCWALYNGFSSTMERLADGNGFKAGGYGSATPQELPNPIPRHVVRFCVAAENKNSGFYANHHPGGGDWTNNSACHNGTNFNMLCRLADNKTDVDGFGHQLVNNLSFYTRKNLERIDESKCVLANNSFSLKLSSKSFVSLDARQLLNPRAENGELPTVDFLRPAKGSAVIDAGAETGLPFLGSAPDIGAFEEKVKAETVAAKPKERRK